MIHLRISSGNLNLGEYGQKASRKKARFAMEHTFSVYESVAYGNEAKCTSICSL
jgi:hypothetical protein